MRCRLEPGFGYFMPRRRRVCTVGRQHAVVYAIRMCPVLPAHSFSLTIFRFAVHLYSVIRHCACRLLRFRLIFAQGEPVALWIVPGSGRTRCRPGEFVVQWSVMTVTTRLISSVRSSLQCFQVGSNLILAFFHCGCR